MQTVRFRVQGERRVRALSQNRPVGALLRIGVPMSSLALWACLWLNLNTGFWNFRETSTLQGVLMAIRAGLTFIVLPISGIILVKNQARLKLSPHSPTRMLGLYGLIAAAASAFSPEPWWSFYWGVAFLATVGAASTWLCQGDAVVVSRRMLQVTWAVTLVVAAVLAYTLRGNVFGNAGAVSRLR